MAHKVLYREWRPTSFEQVVEQGHITKTLRRAVDTGRIAHAYLFSGTRGTGKTSLAKIFARAVNCLNPNAGDPCNKCDICVKSLEENLMDIAEIDAASNNSVDNIRRICDEVNYMPSLAKFKVYIIDEVHMLSTSAFNALLKTLEEPPSHVIFVLCTTEPNKLPATVLSRCQRFDFHRITSKGIIERLRIIAQSEKEKVSEQALEMIARISFGALRDAISLLDQCISACDDSIGVEDVLNCAGLIDDQSNAKVVQALAENDVKTILNSINEVIAEGKSPSKFLSGLLGYLRNILVCMNVEEPSAFIEADTNAINEMKRLSVLLDADKVIYYIKELSENESVLKRASQPKTYLEIMLIGLLVTNHIAKTEPVINTEQPKIVAKQEQASQPQQAQTPQSQPPLQQVKPVAQKVTESKPKDSSWEKYIEGRLAKGSRDVFELKDSAIEINNRQALIIVNSDFNKNSLESNKGAVLEEVKGFNADVTNVKFACSAIKKSVGSAEQELAQIGKKHDITVEIV